MSTENITPQPDATFPMVAKTLQGLEDILADELRSMGALNVEQGRRMVSFDGDLEMLYRANLCCRTALRILKPLFTFEARNPDELYDRVKEQDWSQVLDIDKTFSIDPVVYSDEFTNSRFVTYRVKDAIADWFRDRFGEGKRPGVRLKDADVMLNVHIAGTRVTLSLDSSGESLHKRGYRVASTEAPINEVLAAGIILRSGWRGDTPLVDPMCGSGTFLIEAALIAANIMPGVYRRGFAFEHWPDFDRELFERLYNDDSAERPVSARIYGADISPQAVAIAMRNIKSAGVSRFIDIERRPLSQWEQAPADGVPGIIVTNPPYGERISVDNMEGLYAQLGTKLKNVFKGYHAWVIGYRDEYFNSIGLAASVKLPVLNGALECELREYVIFEGNYDSFRAAGGTIKTEASADKAEKERRKTEQRRDRDSRRREKPGGHKPDFKSDSRKRDFKPGDRKRDFKPGGRKPDFKPGGHKPDFKPGGRKPDFKSDGHKTRHQVAESENPLAVRRNVHALKSIIGRMPTLGSDKTIMRKRRGWKRPDADDTPSDNND